MKVLTLALCALLASPGALLVQQGSPLDIQRSASRLLAESLQATPAAKPPRANDDLYWSGVMMSGIGGGMLGWGLGMGGKSVTCVSGRVAVSCQETGGNRGVFLGVGAAMMGAGVILAAIGGKRVKVAPNSRGMVIIVKP